MRRRCVQTASISVSPPCASAALPSHLPTLMTVIVSPSCDILAIHAKILSILEARAASRPSSALELTSLETELETCMSVPRIRQLEAQIESLRKTAGVTEKETYIGRTRKILATHSKLLSQPSSEDMLEHTVTEYLAIAAEYMPLVIEREKRQVVYKCKHCATSLAGVPTSFGGIRVCPRANCQTENHIFRVTAVVPKEYNVWGNLLKAYDRFVGETELKNINVIMADLDIYFNSIGKLTGEYYRKQPLNAMGRKDGTSHRTLCEAFSVLRYKSYYKNYMYVGHMYYGWELWSLSHLLPQIKRNFDRKQAVWETLTTDQKQGQSNLGTEFRMCMELNHVGIMCDISWFNISTTQKTLEKNYSVYTLMCKGADIPFPHPEAIDA